MAEYLQGDDAAQAEAALLAYVTTLGRLHAATVGRQSRFAAVCRELAPGSARLLGWDPMRDSATAQRVPAFRAACAALDLPVSKACAAELTLAAAAITVPGPFLAYTVGDTCPDNHRLSEASATGPGSLRFFAMEFGGFRPALLDAACLWLPFPTCWCVNRLPESLPPRLKAAYRAALVAGCPAAADDQVFQLALVAACVVWLVLTVAWDFVHVLEQDDDWGSATVRQRLPLRAENVAHLCARCDYLPAVGALAAAFATRVRERWGDAVESPSIPISARTGSEVARWWVREP